MKPARKPVSFPLAPGRCEYSVSVMGHGLVALLLFGLPLQWLSRLVLLTLLIVGFALCFIQWQRRKQQVLVLDRGEWSLLGPGKSEKLECSLSYKSPRLLVLRRKGYRVGGHFALWQDRVSPENWRYLHRQAMADFRGGKQPHPGRQS